MAIRSDFAGSLGLLLRLTAPLLAWQEAYLPHLLIGEARAGDGARLGERDERTWLHRSLRYYKPLRAGRVALDAPALGDDDFASHFLARGEEPGEGVVSELELLRLVDPALELLGQPLLANHRKEHATSCRRIAVGVVAAAAGDADRPLRVAVAPEEAEQHLRTVEDRLDDVGHVRAAAKVSVLRLDLRPALFPVFRVLGVPGEAVAHHLGVAASGRYAGESLLDHLDAVGLEKCRGVHRAHELAGVESVAVVHDPAELLAERDDLVETAWRDESGEVGLDLVVDVVRAGVELRMPAVGRRDAATERVASARVRMPESVLGIGEGNAAPAL